MNTISRISSTGLTTVSTNTTRYSTGSRDTRNWSAEGSALRARPLLVCICTAAAASAAVGETSISPAGNTVPENLLRIELHLDAQLPAPLDMRHVKLSDREGNAIPDALLDMALPSRDGLDVVILLHPGRIKSGVAPNVALGP